MRLIFAGGGTGGHLIPGISLAEEILKKLPHSELLFVSTGKPLEKQLFERFQLSYRVISARPLTKQLQKIPGFFYHTCGAIRQSIRILRDFRPEGIIGLGGYGAAPVLVATKLLKIPFFILEQNAIPGSVNRLFAPFSEKVCCQFEQSLPYFKDLGFLTGNPIRSALKKEVQNARQKLGLEADRFTLLVMGGSQGAQAINRCLAETVQLIATQEPSLK
ncbi:MAG: glycosyltransferase, partial [Planctomycetota bacterium]